MALRSVKRPPSYTYEDLDPHRLKQPKSGMTRNCYSSSDLEGKAAARLKNPITITFEKKSNLPALSLESRKKLRQKEEEEEKQQQEKKRRRHSPSVKQGQSQFDVKPKAVLLLEQKEEELKKKAAVKCDDEFLEICDDGSGYTNKEPAECNDEELIEKYCEGLLFQTIDRKTALKEAPALRKYLIQVEASEGFDIEDWPNLHCIPMSAPYPAKRSPKRDEHYMMLSRFAIEHYNKNNKTNFQVDQLVKVYRAPRGYCFITFSVKNPSQTFQAKVSQTHVSICRPKPGVK